MPPVKTPPSIKKSILINSSAGNLNSITLILASLITSPIIARYTGPSLFGEIAFATSYASLIYKVSSLGLKTEFYRRYSSNIYDNNRLIANAYLLQVITSISLFIVGSSAVVLIANSSEYRIIILLSLLQVLSSISYIPYYILEINHKEYIINISESFARILTFFNVIVITFFNLPLLLIPLNKSFLFFLKLGLVFKRATPIFSLLTFRKIQQYWNSQYSYCLIRSSWKNFVRDTSNAAVNSASIFFLQFYSNPSDVAIFSAAFLFSTAYYFVFVSLTNSIRPSLFKSFFNDKSLFAKRYKRALLFSNSIAILSSLISFILLKSFPVFTFIYGNKFSGSENIAEILVFGGIFVAFNNVGLIWLNAHKLYSISLFKTLSSLCLLIILNLLLVPRFSVIGAAWAFVLSKFWLSHVSLIFFKKGRDLIMIYLNCFNPQILFRQSKA